MNFNALDLPVASAINLPLKFMLDVFFSSVWDGFLTFLPRFPTAADPDLITTHNLSYPDWLSFCNIVTLLFFVLVYFLFSGVLWAALFAFVCLSVFFSFSLFYIGLQWLFIVWLSVYSGAVLVLFLYMLFMVSPGYRYDTVDWRFFTAVYVSFCFLLYFYVIPSEIFVFFDNFFVDMSSTSFLARLPDLSYRLYTKYLLLLVLLSLLLFTVLVASVQLMSLQSGADSKTQKRQALVEDFRT